MTDRHFQKNYPSINSQGGHNSNPNNSSRLNQNNNSSQYATGDAASSSNPQPGLVNSSQQENIVETSNLNSETLGVVEEFKRKIREKSNLTENDIELYASRARQTLKIDQFNIDKWRAHLAPDIVGNPDDTIKILMAYGDNPDEVKPILRAKLKKNDVKSNAATTDKPIEISLEQVAIPLKDLYRKMSNAPRYNIFEAVLRIPSNQYDRADRMFYSEACQLMNNPTDYKIEHAHDQVEAIRLTHYASDNISRLKELIDRYRTFDEAYRYLQNLSRKGMIPSSTTSTRVSSARDRPSSSSIIREPKNDDTPSNPSTPSASGTGGGPFGTYGSSSPGGRLSSETNRPGSGRQNTPSTAAGSTS